MGYFHFFTHGSVFVYNCFFSCNSSCCIIVKQIPPLCVLLAHKYQLLLLSLGMKQLSVGGFLLSLASPLTSYWFACEWWKYRASTSTTTAAAPLTAGSMNNNHLYFNEIASDSPLRWCERIRKNQKLYKKYKISRNNMMNLSVTSYANSMYRVNRLNYSHIDRQSQTLFSLCMPLFKSFLECEVCSQFCHTLRVFLFPYFDCRGNVVVQLNELHGWKANKWASKMVNQFVVDENQIVDQNRQSSNKINKLAIIWK